MCVWESSLALTSKQMQIERGVKSEDLYYRIAVVFGGSKFSRIAVLEEFVEKNSGMGVAQFATPIIR